MRVIRPVTAGWIAALYSVPCTKLAKKALASTSSAWIRKRCKVFGSLAVRVSISGIKSASTEGGNWSI
ncbi:Uncharacterised protein [Vibrio cholerae]|nr:Uncharacterised protein [Vibrio cholerae]CSI57566.1 Uncharacterised protein [Vibrio cholerae]